MWNWILLVVIVGALVALLTVAAIRQRRYSGDKPIGRQHGDNTKEGSTGGGTGGSG